MKSLPIFLNLVIIEMIVIAVLLTKLNKEYGKELLTNDIVPLKRSQLVFPAKSELNNYYEPRANTTEEVKVDWLDYKPRYSYNMDTLHENQDYSFEKPIGTYRIVTLGDSFTFGQYLENTADNWTEQLEEKLNISSCAQENRFEVINLGVFGYDIEYAAERFSRRGKKYNPDLVIWFLKDDDFKIINELFMPLEQKIAQEMRLDKYSTEYCFKNGVAYPSWQETTKKFSELYGKKEIFNYQQKVIKRFLNTYEERLLFFTFPRTNKTFKDYLGRLSTKSNIYFNDQISDIYTDKEAVLSDSHPSKKGHKIISEDLFHYLLKNDVIPCP